MTAVTLTEKSWGILSTRYQPAGPPPVTGYYGDAPILEQWDTLTLTYYANTFDVGTTPGNWLPSFTGDREGTPTTATWQVDITGTVYHFGFTCSVEIVLELNFDPLTQSTIFSATMADGDTLPLNYSNTFAALGNIALPTRQGHSSPGTYSVLLGNAAFTWRGP